MRGLRVLSGLTILVGVILAATPWLLHFRRDRAGRGGRPGAGHDLRAMLVEPRPESSPLTGA